MAYLQDKLQSFKQELSVPEEAQLKRFDCRQTELFVMSLEETGTQGREMLQQVGFQGKDELTKSLIELFTVL